MRSSVLVLCAALMATTSGPAREEPTSFAYPCADYVKGLRSGGNFGTYVDSPGRPFHHSWHLAEDVWLPAGTTVFAVADGVVRYSAFSPTWTDAKGFVHWNLGNVIVIEHELAPPIGELDRVCSFYVHLAADRRVAVGERVARGQCIGRIGANRSDENGRYPAHLHFGLHKGPYFQFAPAFERHLVAKAASKDGLRAGDTVLRGELEFRRQGDTTLIVTSKSTGASIVLSLLVGSTAPKDPPPDIMSWCEGYGDKPTLEEWLKPSAFLREHLAAARTR
jgi:murein DD-endopeptidase MepM/ murein hydrolase activator NlpD